MRNENDHAGVQGRGQGGGELMCGKWWAEIGGCHAGCVRLCIASLRFLLQRYNTRHPTWHLLAFSIAKMGENMRLTNGYSVFYNQWKNFQNFSATAQKSPPTVKRNATRKSGWITIDQYVHTACVLINRHIPLASVWMKDARTVRPYLPFGKLSDSNPHLALQITDYSYFETHMLPSA